MRIMMMLGAMALMAITAHAQWTIENSNSTASLRGVHSLGGGIAWASGTNGTVLRTEDGGFEWQTCSMPPGAEKLDFRGIQGFDANTAIVMSSGKGDLSRIYKTTDGCHSWKLIFTNPDKEGFWDAIQFRNKDFGVLLGDPVDGRFYSRLTSDGGQTWQRFDNDENLKTSDPNAGAFAASNTALFVPKNPNWLLAVVNVNGKSALFENSFGVMPCAHHDCPKGLWWWKPEDLKLGHDTAGKGVFSVAALLNDGGRIEAMVAVGGDYEKPDASAATASFASAPGDWNLAQTPPHGYRSAVAYDAATKTWITIGPNGTDISIDDGKNWRAVKPNSTLNEPADADKNWNAISLPFVVGPHGRIGKLNEPAIQAALTAK
jgi:hypothetical protein